MQPPLTPLYFNSSTRFRIERRVVYARRNNAPDQPHNRDSPAQNDDASALINSNRRASTMLHRATVVLSARAMTKRSESIYSFVSRVSLRSRRGRGSASERISCVINRRRLPAYAIAISRTRHVCAVKRSPILASGIGTRRTELKSRR